MLTTELMHAELERSRTLAMRNVSLPPFLTMHTFPSLSLGADPPRQTGVQLQFKALRCALSVQDVREKPLNVRNMQGKQGATRLHWNRMTHSWHELCTRVRPCVLLREGSCMLWSRGGCRHEADSGWVLFQQQARGVRRPTAME